MKMKIAQFILCLICVSCSAQKTENKNILSIPSIPEIVYEIGNGEMFDGAVKIKNAKNSKEGIEAETKYMEHKFGIINIDWKPFGSEFYEVKRKQYNLIHIQVFNKEDKTKEDFKTIYFDITECWGK
jgi:malic enzyme